MNKVNIIGVIYPISKDVEDRVFNDKKNVFTKYIAHTPSEKTIRIKSGDKLFFYKSKSGRKVVGESIIDSIEFLNYHQTVKSYSENTIISPEKLKKYSNGRENKKMLVFHLKKFKKYKNEKTLKKPLTMAGLYVTTNNINKIFEEVDSND